MGETTGLKTPQGNQAWCPQQVMEGTQDLQVTFAWAPQFGTLLGQVPTSQWHLPLADPPTPVTVHISHRHLPPSASGRHSLPGH